MVIGWGTANYGTVWTATSPNLLAIDQASQSVAKCAIGYQLTAATTAVIPEFAAAGNPSNAILGTASFMMDDQVLPKSWPNPTWPIPAIFLKDAHPTKNLALTAVPPDGHITATDLPPREAGRGISLRIHTQQGALALLHPPEVVVPTLPAYLWSNPYGPTWPNNLLSWTAQYLPKTPPGNPFSQTDWPVPKGYNWAGYALGWSNEIIGPVPPHVEDSPFNQYRWPVPARPHPSSWSHGWSNEVIGPPASPPAAKPFSQNEWVVPGRNDWPLDMMTVLNPAIEMPRPGSQTSWPNPRLSDFSRYSMGWSNEIIGPVPASTNIPFFQTNWPVPHRNDWPLELVTILNPSIEVTKPFAKNEWPNPIPPQRANILLTHTQNFLRLIGQGPFFQTSWPNPRGAARANGLLTLSNGIPPAPTPFRPLDWPNPRGPAKALQKDVWSSAQVLREPTAGKPQPITDWPVPHRNEWPLALMTYLNPGIEVSKPFLQNDWPNPIPPRRVIDHLTYVQTFTRTDSVMGFNQYNWPNPRGKAPPPQFHTRSLPAEQLLRPFKQTDWPNPKGPRSPLEIFHIVKGSLPTPIPPQQKGFNQYDWPLPKGPRAPVETYGINKSSLPIEPPPPPPITWGVAEKVMIVNSGENATRVRVVDTPANATKVLLVQEDNNARKIIIVHEESGYAEKIYFINGPI